MINSAGQLKREVAVHGWTSVIGLQRVMLIAEDLGLFYVITDTLITCSRSIV